MKRAKKRDPAREPHAARIDDDERAEKIARVDRGASTDEDIADLQYDHARAIAKLSAAAMQLRAPDEERFALFSRPDLSASSATATCETYFKPASEWIRSGAIAKRIHRDAGLGRHSEWNDPATALRFKERRAAWKTIDDESRAKGRARLHGRRLARAIATRTDEPEETIRTWIKNEEKRRAQFCVPRISPGDFSQLVG